VKAELGILWDRSGLNDYGQGIYKTGFINAAWKLFEDATFVVRGEDRILDIDKILRGKK